MTPKQWGMILVVLIVLALLLWGWRLLGRKQEQPIIQFTPEQAEKERQRWQGSGRGPQPLQEGTLPLPPKGKR